ncbi:MAG TPA: hypothetical protein VHM90_03045 [Phycisphaerae bacterium]|nr:hypothetical protein [Phycisphaerae bacterium]
MSRQLCLTLAVVAVSGFMVGCEADDSLPTRPRTAFMTDDQAQQHAEQKALESPSKSLPGAGSEFPGQRSAKIVDASGQVVTLAIENPGSAASRPPTNPDFPIKGFTGPSGWNAWGHTYGPETTYPRDTYKHVLPAIPVNPGTTPMTGFIQAPDGDWTIDDSWGQGITLENYPHRPWAQANVPYVSGGVQHNPTYYFNLMDHIDAPSAGGPRSNDIVSALVETPWFFANTLALPVLMALEPPFAVRTTERASGDPNYLGSVPTQGPLVPVPTAGKLQWTYPFLNPDGTMKQSKDLATRPRE